MLRSQLFDNRDRFGVAVIGHSEPGWKCWPANSAMWNIRSHQDRSCIWSTILNRQKPDKDVGISCDEVMGDAGLFSQFLQFEGNEALPDPWRFLEGAIGAPKFVSRRAFGFHVQRISN